MRFSKWLLEKELLEVFDKSSFMAQEPESGVWEPPLKAGEVNLIFRYSLPSDPQKKCNGKPCYYVSLANGDISFGHEITRYSDRWEENKRIANGDKNIEKKLGQENLNSVLHAIGKYVEVVKPNHLNWYAVNKTRGNLGSPSDKGSRKSLNPNARGKIYFKWAGRNLYPDYVPNDEDTWINFSTFKNSTKRDYGVDVDKEEIRNLGAEKFLEMLRKGAFQHEGQRPPLPTHDGSLSGEWERRLYQVLAQRQAQGQRQIVFGDGSVWSPPLGGQMNYQRLPDGRTMASRQAPAASRSPQAPAAFGPPHHHPDGEISSEYW